MQHRDGLAYSSEDNQNLLTDEYLVTGINKLHAAWVEIHSSWGKLWQQSVKTAGGAVLFPAAIDF
jgi:hypothetical protein